MIKKKNKGLKQEVYKGDKNISTENIADRATENILLFAKNTNVMRQLPRVEDGLKTVERRILYALFELNGLPNRPLQKCARIVGDTMGKFHPHGDSSTYGTLARLAQPWESATPLIHGQGNFGSQIGAPPAAMRYTEAKLSKYTYMCFFKDFNIKHVETRLNYLGTEPEPVYFPSRYPNILGNSSQFGIGVGTNVIIPHFNFQEVMEVTMNLMDKPNAEFLLIPDSPTGSDIVATGPFKEINEIGRGTFQMRAIIDVDEEEHQLIIRSLPMQVTYKGIHAKIMKLVQDKKITELIDILDASDEGGSGIQIHVLLKKEADLYKFRQLLFSLGLSKSVGVNIRAVDNYKEFDYSVRELLLTWIDLRREDKRMKFNNEILDLRERLHVLSNIVRVFTGKNAEKSLDTIRRASDKDEIIKFLMEDFNISSLQARTIADMRMSTFSKKGISSLKNEYDEINKELPRLLKIIKSAKSIDKIIKDELKEGIEMFGEPRRSRLISPEGKIAVRNTEHILVITHNNKIKKLPVDSKTVGHIDSDDYPSHIMKIKNTEDLMIFDESGNINTLSINDVVNTVSSSSGDDLSKYIEVTGRICEVIQRPTDEEMEDPNKYILMVSRNGLIKKTATAKFKGSNKVIAMIMKETDVLQSVKVIDGDQDVLVYTHTGLGGRFSTSEIRESNRMSVGVKSLDIEEGVEQIIGMDIVNPLDKYIFVLTSKGFGKKCTLETFTAIQRNTKPYKIITLSPQDAITKVVLVKGTETYTAFLSDASHDIIIDDVDEMPRLSKGKKLVPVRKGVNIIDIKERK